MTEEEVKEINDMYENCEGNKYLKKYGIYYLSNDSQKFKDFVAFLYNIEKDTTEKLKLKFLFYRNKSYGRDYLRYSLIINDNFSTKELFIQIPYNEENYKTNRLFTIANIYNELYAEKDCYYEGEGEFREDFRKLVEEAEKEFYRHSNKINK